MTSGAVLDKGGGRVVGRGGAPHVAPRRVNEEELRGTDDTSRTAAAPAWRDWQETRACTACDSLWTGMGRQTRLRPSSCRGWPKPSGQLDFIILLRTLGAPDYRWSSLVRRAAETTEKFIRVMLSKCCEHACSCD